MVDKQHILDLSALSSQGPKLAQNTNLLICIHPQDTYCDPHPLLSVQVRCCYVHGNRTMTLTEQVWHQTQGTWEGGSSSCTWANKKTLLSEPPVISVLYTRSQALSLTRPSDRLQSPNTGHHHWQADILTSTLLCRPLRNGNQVNSLETT